MSYGDDTASLFWKSEICLSAGPIDYTGMETPDVILAVGDDGGKPYPYNQGARAAGQLSKVGCYATLVAETDAQRRLRSTSLITNTIQ